jgi:hypothetical protein
MTNAIKVLLQMQSGFLQLESTLNESVSASVSNPGGTITNFDLVS